MCCNADGGVIDDLIAYLVSDDEVFLIPNAANTAAVVAALAAGRARRASTVVDRHTDFGVLAVQGPASAEVLQCARAAARTGLHVLGRRRFRGPAGPGLPHRIHR